LGLYIAKEAINSLGGNIQVSSKSKETLFDFQIPNHQHADH
jgi:signal transduction histidine kinase